MVTKANKSITTTITKIISRIDGGWVFQRLHFIRKKLKEVRHLFNNGFHRRPLIWILFPATITK